MTFSFFTKLRILRVIVCQYEIRSTRDYVRNLNPYIIVGIHQLQLVNWKWILVFYPFGIDCDGVLFFFAISFLINLSLVAIGFESSNFMSRPLLSYLFHANTRPTNTVNVLSR